MIRRIALCLLLTTICCAQRLRLSEAVASLPLFEYPALAKIAKIQGHLEMTIHLKEGKVLSVTPPDGLKDFRPPQLSPLVTGVVQKMQFRPTATGELTLHIFYRLGLPSDEPKTRITIDSYENTVVIESTTAKLTVCPAPPK